MPPLPGTLDRHRIITPEMRRRPNGELVMEMTDHVEESLTELLEDEDDDVYIHVAVTVEC